MPGSNAEFGMVTTTRMRPRLFPEAMRIAERLGLPFVRRDLMPFEEMFAAYGVPAFYVVSDKAPSIQTPAGKIIFHEGSAALRTKDDAGPNALVRAMDLQPEDHVLDATLGFATDALVIADALDGGEVLGLEYNPMVEDLVRIGLKDGPFAREHLRIAAGRIRTQRADHAEFLRNAPDRSFDVVYFDPMFSVTVQASPMMQRLKAVAEGRPLADDTIMQARRVARRCVVLKCRRGVFDHVRVDRTFPSGRTLVYGVIDAL